MSKQAPEYPVLSIQDLLSNDKYLIPRYQRNYAWTEEHIAQLVEDVLDNVDTKTPYYLGTLVVYPRKEGSFVESYEVIDGQQRLTTLTLLVSYLTQEERKEGDSSNHWFDEINLDFESRQISSTTLKHAHSGRWFTDKLNGKDTEHNEEIAAACEIIARVVLHKCREKGIESNRFKRYFLDQVKICRVTVPGDTDLNHYFEIMNNRGEQLEKHEILKARLMEKLDKDDQVAFNEIWEACSIMDKYVQYGFSKKIREGLFGKDWKTFEWTEADTLFNTINELADSESQEDEIPLSMLLAPPKTKDKDSLRDDNQDEEPERFNSVINFPNFLLHALSIYKEAGDIPLDDKQLLGAFERLVTKEEIKEFASALLEMRFLFDHYVIKRDGEMDEREWSMKELHLTANGNPSYRNTFGGDGDEVQEQIIMLQSMFHVSVPSRSYKYWLQGLLYFLYNYKFDSESLLKHLELMAMAFVFDRFLAKEPKDYEEIIFWNACSPKTKNWDGLNWEKTKYGQIQNILLFNFIDYLLWEKELKKQKPDSKIRAFKFSFRSSIEHYYPQNPIGGNPIENKQLLHSIGNLCLISHGKNAQLRHHLPRAKKEYYDKQPYIDSIKQYLMLEDAENWSQDAEGCIKGHEDLIVKLLNTTLNE